MKKEFIFRGKSLEELQQMSITEFAQMLNARQRRSLTRGMSEQHKTLLKKVNKQDKNIRTHCRDMVILPQMVDATIRIYSGKEFIPVIILPEMIGHYLGEFVLPRKKVEHHAPGIGATRSSASLSVR